MPCSDTQRRTRIPIRERMDHTGKVVLPLDEVAVRRGVQRLKQLGVAHIFGLSTQDTDFQREAVERLHLPFPVLSDADLKLARAIKLPTFTTSGMTLLKRLGSQLEVESPKGKFSASFSLPSG